MEEEEQEGLFAIETLTSRGVRRARHARHVILAIGYYYHPVMLGIPARSCRTSTTTTASRTRTIASASSSSAAGIRRRNQRSDCFAPGPT